MLLRNRRCGVNVVEIGEPIGMLAAFSGGSVQPREFSWRRKAYEIDAVNGKWIDRTRQCPSLHFSVQVGDETYYIHYSGSQTQWWLDQVITE